MATPAVLRYRTLIIACLASFLIAVFPFPASHAEPAEESGVEVSSFGEFTDALEQLQSTGGTVVLTQDVTVPAGESYVYNNGRYRKEITVETCGHTIRVEGYLSLWPFLTVRGSGAEIFRVCAGGDLRMVSIALDAGEDGTAVIQDEGAFLTLGSEEDMGLPAFSCTGRIVTPQTVTAAASWSYDCAHLPVVRVPDGADFSAGMLPGGVPAFVNRDYAEFEETVPVVWDESTFPAEPERTLVTGAFAQGYTAFADDTPRCLVVWESDEGPFFLNVYLEQATQSYEMVYMHGESSRPGTVRVQASDDGEAWTEITGTDGYAPVQTQADSSFFWLLTYDRTDPAQARPRYYRMVQVTDDGTEVFSDALGLSGDMIFTAADIEGGRGGETSPDEGDDPLDSGSEDSSPSESVPESAVPQPPAPSSSQSSAEPAAPASPETAAADPGSRADAEAAAVFEPDEPQTAPGVAASSGAQEAESVSSSSAQEPEGSDSAPPHRTGASDRIAGTAAVLCILAAAVALSVFLRRNK